MDLFFNDGLDACHNNYDTEITVGEAENLIDIAFPNAEINTDEFPDIEIDIDEFAGIENDMEMLDEGNIDKGENDYAEIYIGDERGAEISKDGYANISRDDSGMKTTMISLQLHEIPKIGMTFDNLDSVSKFWSTYASKKGFNGRVDYRNKSKKDQVIINVVYVCSKEGTKKCKTTVVDNSRCRANVRTKCKARLNVVLDRKLGKYKVRQFVEEHNHELETRATSYMLKENRNVTEAQGLAIELANDSGISLRAAQELFSREAGGRIRVGFTKEDQKTHLRYMRRKKHLNGELGRILHYFEKQNLTDPKFSYKLQLDYMNDITNMFWVDSKMVADYIIFGDVLNFDTTFGTNKEFRSFGVFTGFNHHKQIVVFGAALLFDETAASFKWLFESFLSAHDGKKPQTIFTDQAPAIASALESVWSTVHHGLCTFHIRQNAIKNLSSYMKRGSEFFPDFKRCMFENMSEIEFENEWEALLNKHKLHENKWLKTMYLLKKQWAKAYMKKFFTLGIRSTQVAESLNSHLKLHLKSNLSIADFFIHFDRIVDEKRLNEEEAEFQMRQTVPSLGYSTSPLLLQASRIYTPKIFALFHEQFGLSDSVIITNENPIQLVYTVTSIHSQAREFEVIWDPNNESARCSCNMFETKGLFCSHVLRVFSRLAIMKIPEKYFLPRWTRTIRSQCVLDEVKINVDEDAKNWVKRIQSRFYEFHIKLQ